MRTLCLWSLSDKVNLMGVLFERVGGKKYNTYSFVTGVRRLAITISLLLSLLFLYQGL